MEFLKIFGIFILLNLIIYLIRSFIVFDFDPSDWWLIKTTTGRIFLVFLEIGLLGKSIDLNSN